MKNKLYHKDHKVQDMSLNDFDWYLNKAQSLLNKKESRIIRDTSVVKRHELPEDLRDLFDQLLESVDE